MKGTVDFNARPPRPAWGIRPLPRKTISLAQPIRTLPPPKRVVIPINQCLGMAARPLVTEGQHVLTGESIAGAVSPSANLPGPRVHASISGIVTAIESRAVAGRDGSDHLCIIIDSDGKDHPYPGFDELGEPMCMAPEDICRHIATAGIVGLGGALYSTATKLLTNQPIDTLILNGAECEPYITCDEILMRDHAANILRGTQIMMRALGTPLAIIAVESDMPEARVALYDAIEADGCDNIHVAVVGIVCHNVGTAAAVADLFDRRRPLISRIVTVTGRGIESPGNLEVRIGTPVHELFAICGGLHADVSHLIMGGPMMGITLPDDSLPITKATNCVIVMQAGDVSPVQTEMPCIRCGECLQVCPSRLLPQELLTATRQHDMDALEEFGLTACIECGCCDYVCPSQIQLTSRFITAKAALSQHRIDQRRAEHAKQRYTAREARLTAQHETEAAALEQQAAGANTDSIEAIMERARDKNQSE